MLRKLMPVAIAILVVIVVAYLCMNKEPALSGERVKKEMCINADVMDSENFGKQVECD